MSEPETMVDIRNLVVQFRTRRGLDAILSRKPAFLTAVDDVSLTIRKGEIFGLVGESGSGKTTLGKALLRLVTPTSGEIRFEGRDIAQLSERQLRPVRRRLQTVFQDPLSSLNPRHKVADALATPLKLHKIVPPARISDKVDEILTRVGLSPVFRDRYPHELSGGQLQRVAIGRALTMEPSFLVADEAVSKLDVSVRAQILNLFKDIQASYGMTMLFITHDLHVARYLCTRIGVMYFGKLVEVGPTEALFRAPVHPYTRALLSTAGGAKLTGGKLLAEEAFNPTEDDRVGCRFYKRCAIREDRCGASHPGMESVDTEHEVACYAWRKTARRPEAA
ncbi:ABC transporter ATP-binding protein [Rhodoligotrophos defluvii]|uniref:ABC transporter ATP-binding protein n=1 Tax=Rhodoligotrophos defluvii TaxID=2561934 RepID=UPI0010C96C53|nr:oligopeptide/dipeptide ABC transporter ATP-binding protein [Rhodoligotrophos defluvii]